MLDGFSKIEHLADNANEIKIAIWFHDIIYDSTKSDNEERSAELAYRLMIESKIDERVAKKVKKLILATKHNGGEKTTDEKIITDLDLAVLGLDKKTFDEYSELLHKESGFKSEKEYWKSRKKVLERFLNQKKLFKLDYFKKRYEKQAEKNLKEGIKEVDKILKEQHNS